MTNGVSVSFRPQLARFSAAWQAEKLHRPRPILAPPIIILSLALLVAPYFIMMPGMGAGIAGAKTPRLNLTRLKSVLSHCVFALGMYLTAVLIAKVPGY